MDMIWLFVFFGSGILVIDRWLKYLAMNGVSREFGFAQFVLFKNEALVFSWPAPNSVAIVLMLLAMAVIAVLAWRRWQKKALVALIGCLLMLVGASSNIYDRIAYGFVIDWAYLGPWWPVFNLADVLIGLGLLLVLFRHRRLTT